jgi:hypothetical protein
MRVSWKICLIAHFWIGDCSNECSEGLGFDRFCVRSPCNFLIENYTKIFYAN